MMFEIFIFCATCVVCLSMLIGVGLFVFFTHVVLTLPQRFLDCLEIIKYLLLTKRIKFGDDVLEYIDELQDLLEDFEILIEYSKDLKKNKNEIIVANKINAANKIIAANKINATNENAVDDSKLKKDAEITTDKADGSNFYKNPSDWPKLKST